MKALFVLVGVAWLAISSSLGEAASGEFQKIDAELIGRAVIMQLPDGVRRVAYAFSMRKEFGKPAPLPICGEARAT